MAPITKLSCENLLVGGNIKCEEREEWHEHGEEAAETPGEGGALHQIITWL